MAGDLLLFVCLQVVLIATEVSLALHVLCQGRTGGGKIGQLQLLIYPADFSQRISHEILVTHIADP